MHPYAQLRLGHGFQPLRAAMYYSQRLAVGSFTRAFAADLIASAINLGGRRDRPSTATDSDPAVQTLVQDGIVHLQPLLSVAEVDQLVDWLRDQPLVGPGGKLCRFDELPPATGLAPYPLQTILASEKILAIANNPMILAVAGSYLHCRPTISSVGIRWSFPDGAAHRTTQRFHRDLDDWRSLKLFIYLTDVSKDGGPHVYVKGSQRSRASLRARPYSFEEVERRFGVGSLEVVEGARGTSFLADVFGIHRGVPPLDRPRLMLQVQYSILPVYAFSYEPLAISTARPLDRYVNRLLIKPAAA